MTKLTVQEKRNKLKEIMGEIVASYHGGDGDIINAKTEIRVTKENIEKIVKRKQCYTIDSFGKRIWDERSQR